MSAGWFCGVLAVVFAVGGYLLGTRGLGKPEGPRGPRSKTITVTRDPKTERCVAKTVPPSLPLSKSAEDTIEWKVRGHQCLSANPGAVVQIRFRGTSPVVPPAPTGLVKIAAQVQQEAELGRRNYQVWLKMPNEAESYCMEDPELLIEI